MPVLVTGGTGFIGSRLVRRLLARGEEVRCFVRKWSEHQTNLKGLNVEKAYGDLRDPATLEAAAKGCRVIYHVAADYRLWARDPQELYEANVEGTKNVLAAAEKAGCERIVYCSSVGALGIPRDGRPGSEKTPVHLDEMVGHYKRSKFLAEQEALKAVDRGLPIVIVNPSTPVGPNDIKPTETGKIIVRFLHGKMPAYLDTGLNFIDVDDVAEGHILAAEKGRIGEKYILGHKNLTLRGFLQCLAEVTGRPAPRVRIPYALALACGAVSTFFEGKVSGGEPGIPIEGVRMAKKKMYFDAAKAVKELGLPQSPVEDAVERAVRWFCHENYAPLPKRMMKR
jgi:dihydroflavonol-4-reductase